MRMTAFLVRASLGGSLGLHAYGHRLADCPAHRVMHCPEPSVHVVVCHQPAILSTVIASETILTIGDQTIVVNECPTTLVTEITLTETTTQFIATASGEAKLTGNTRHATQMSSLDISSSLRSGRSTTQWLRESSTVTSTTRDGGKQTHDQCRQRHLVHGRASIDSPNDEGILYEGHVDCRRNFQYRRYIYCCCYRHHCHDRGVIYEGNIHGSRNVEHRGSIYCCWHLSYNRGVVYKGNIYSRRNVEHRGSIYCCWHLSYNRGVVYKGNIYSSRNVEHRGSIYCCWHLSYNRGVVYKGNIYSSRNVEHRGSIYCCWHLSYNRGVGNIYSSRNVEHRGSIYCCWHLSYNRGVINNGHIHYCRNVEHWGNICCYWHLCHDRSHYSRNIEH
ncbi:hypothetical protein RJ55_07788 [Drechmeria coniospora]|nr:hypothetical protein RJ55_07788 [Drechmeria coniospora]